MYKNFTLTESERKEILGMHRENGYGETLNEQSTPDGAKISVLKIFAQTPDDLTDGGKNINPSKASIELVLDNGIKGMKNQQYQSDWSVGFNQPCIGLFTNLQGGEKLNRAIDLNDVPGCVFSLMKKGETVRYNCTGAGCKQQTPKIGTIGKSVVKPLGEEETEVDELDHAGFQDRDDLQVLRDAIDRNKMVSVAFVKKDGTVRHMLVRKSLKSYVGSDAEKTDAQMNVEANNDLKKVVDINAYKRELKRLRNDNPEMNPDEMKTMAAKTCWRSISLKNVLGFMVSGQFIDLRDENDIMGRFGEEVNNSLTRSMVNAMNQEVAQEEEPEMENEPQAPEPGQENPEENPDGPINESLMKIRSEFKRFL